MLWMWPLDVGCYTYSDIAGDIDSKKSNWGTWLLLQGSCFIAIQVAKVYGIVHYEGEYIAITEACKEMLWMRRFLNELGMKHEHFVVYVMVKV